MEAELSSEAYTGMEAELSSEAYTGMEAELSSEAYTGMEAELSSEAYTGWGQNFPMKHRYVATKLQQCDNPQNHSFPYAFLVLANVIA
jgi:hypothetical protein